MCDDFLTERRVDLAQEDARKAHEVINELKDRLAAAEQGIEALLRPSMRDDWLVEVRVGDLRRIARDLTRAPVKVVGRCPEHHLTYCEPCGWVTKEGSDE